MDVTDDGRQVNPDAEQPEADANAPVYDERGNVRPRGTKGARPMTHAERVRIAARLAAEAKTEGDQTAPAPKKQTRTRGRSSR